MEDPRQRFEAIYRRCEQPVLAYAMRRAPVDSARDAAAEAFVVAWRRLHEVPEDPLPWLIGVTRKALANQRRSTARQQRLTERLAVELDDPIDSDVVADQVLRRAFRQLSPTDRETLTLLAWDDMTPAQAARSLGCSSAAFRVRAHRARRRLAQALRQEGELESLELTIREAS